MLQQTPHSHKVPKAEVNKCKCIIFNTDQTVFSFLSARCSKNDKYSSVHVSMGEETSHLCRWTNTLWSCEVPSSAPLKENESFSIKTKKNWLYTEQYSRYRLSYISVWDLNVPNVPEMSSPAHLYSVLSSSLLGVHTHTQNTQLTTENKVFCCCCFCLFSIYCYLSWTSALLK